MVRAMDISMKNVEHVRENYRPARVRVLFVGESPPTSGGFFYFGSGIVCSSTQRAFSQALGVTFATPSDFLDFFRDVGCFLEDLSHSPVDHLPPHRRTEALELCVDSFAKRLQELAPELVIVFLKKIAPLVERAVGEAGIPLGMVRVLPFPGNGHQNRYIAGLTKILSETAVRSLLGLKT